MKQANKGFTLVELIVTMVIAGIVLVTISIVLADVSKVTRSSRLKQERFNEQSMIVSFFNKTIDQINLNGYDVTIDFTNDYFFFSDYSDNINFLVVGSIDNHSTITYNSQTLNYYRIKNIDIKPYSTSNKVFEVEITYDNDDSYVFSLCLIKNFS